VTTNKIPITKSNELNSIMSMYRERYCYFVSLFVSLGLIRLVQQRGAKWKSEVRSRRTTTLLMPNQSIRAQSKNIVTNGGHNVVCSDMRDSIYSSRDDNPLYKKSMPSQTRSHYIIFLLKNRPPWSSTIQSR
jgi:hypothetical protein